MVKTIKVYSKTSGKVCPFAPSKIKEKLSNETDLSNVEIDKITTNVANKIRKNYTEISTSEIRVLVNNQLLKKSHDMQGSEVFGMTKQQIEDLLEQGCKDNANISFSAQMVAKYMFDAVSKPYASSIMPKYIADAYNNGDIHQHDKEYYVLGSNCFQYDLRYFARNGFIPDGKGETGAVSNPPKHMRVLLNHILEAMQSGSVCLSGGQGIANFNTFLAPFARGLSYREIYQEMEGFFFNCNQSLVSKGQIVFSSIGVDLSIPDVLADEPAVCPNNTINGTYKDYQDEANMIFKAICEVSEKGDAWGQFFRFPNVIFNIRKGDLDEYKGNAKLLHELAVVRPNIYFANLTKQEKTIMGCRTQNPLREGLTYEDSCLNTGNFMYDTINLPMIALKSNSLEEVYDRLWELCELIKEDLLFRRSIIEKRLFENHMSDFLIRPDNETGKPMYDLDRLTYSIGFNGLHEMICILKNKNIVVDGEDIVKFIANRRDEFGEQTGLRWSLIGSPAESTSMRFAKICLEQYPEETVYQGTLEKPYFTNSSHLPVNNNETMIENIKNADKYHKYCNGGNILHIFTGEAWSDPKAWFSLNKKICDTNISFWAYTKDFSICNHCHYTINTLIDECPVCGSKDIDHFSRVTGYMTRVKTWCDGKFQEFKDRTRFLF